MVGVIVAGILAVGGYALYQHARKGRDAGPDAPPESLPAPQGGGGGGGGTQDGQVFTAKIPQGNFVLTARERVPFDVQFRPVDRLKRPADTPGLSVSLPFVALKDTNGVAVGVEIRDNTLYVRAECPPDTVPIFIDRTTTVRTPTAPACEARAAKLKLRLRNWQLAFLVALLVCFAQPLCFVFARRAGIV